jgi:hypothetical protein
MILVKSEVVDLFNGLSQSYAGIATQVKEVFSL